MMGISSLVSKLLGISAFQKPRSAGPSEQSLNAVRASRGGSIAPIPFTKTRWYLADLEDGRIQADTGNLVIAGQVHRSMRADGVFAGLMGTRTSGLVRLPMRFFGNAEQIQALQASNGTPSIFEQMCPASELALLASDGINLGVGLAELIEVEGRDHPVLVRHDPERLMYRWSEGVWYFNSAAGPIPITPGDGRWVLHIPGGRYSPWQSGLVWCLGRAFIMKEHALNHRANYSAVLANPARAAVAPLGATETQREGFIERLIAWGLNSVFELPIGWDVRLIESNGRGYDVFEAEIASCNKEIITALAGQEVTTTGGSGFANADIHKSIRSDLIKADADGLAHTLNTQVLPIWVAKKYGEAVLDAGDMAQMGWDVDPPKDRKAEADAMKALGDAVVVLNEAIKSGGKELNLSAILDRFGVLVQDLPTAAAVIDDSELDPARVKQWLEIARYSGLDADKGSIQLMLEAESIKASPSANASPTTKIELAPTDIAKVVRVDEVRQSQGLPPIGGTDGAMTLLEYSESKKTEPTIQAVPQ
jgi:hypothetical protein